MTTHFYIKDPEKAKGTKEETLIQLFINLQCRKIKISTGFKVKYKDWDIKKERVKKSHNNSVQLNILITNLEQKVKNLYLKCKMEGKKTFEEIRQAIKDGVKDNKQQVFDFYETFDEFIKRRTQTLSPKTIQKYNTLKKHLKRFEDTCNYELSFKNVNQTFFEKFEGFMYSEVGLSKNSFDKYARTFKTFMGWSFDNNLHSNFEYKRFKTKPEKTIIVHLNRKEVMKLSSLDLSHNKTYDKVRDVFVFQCLTGQRFSDIEAIKREDIREGVWHLRTQKTRDIIQVPLVQLAKDILDKYKNDLRPLPTMTNQRTNLYIKEICKIAQLSEPITKTKYYGNRREDTTKPKYEFITTHVARKSFATIANENGMTHTEIMDITGHKDLKTLQAYLGTDSKVIKKKMNSIWS